MSHALEPGRHTLLVDGRPQVYHVHGSGPICVAQAGGPGVDYAYLRSRALEQHLTMVYMEPIGTGGSARYDDDTEQYSLARYVHHLNAVITRLGRPKVHVLGHSHGGFVAHRLAATNDSRLAGLISYGSSPRWGTATVDEATRQLAMIAGRLPHRAEAAGLLDVWMTGFPPTEQGYTSFLRAMLPAYFRDYWSDEQRLKPLRDNLHAWPVPQALQPFDDRAALRDIRIPTLIVLGEHDFICGPRWAAETKSAIAQSRLVTFTGSGHMVHLEEPDRFARTVAGFCLDTAGGPN